MNDDQEEKLVRRERFHQKRSDTRKDQQRSESSDRPNRERYKRKRYNYNEFLDLEDEREEWYE